MNRQYIGARYVPKFAEPVEWDSTRSYEALTIVTHNNNSYTSKKNVSKGIDIENTEYWVLTGNYNEQIISALSGIKDLKTATNMLKLNERKLSYDTMNIKNSISLLDNYYEECICYNPLMNCFVVGVRDLSDNSSKLCIMNTDFTLNKIINLNYTTISEISYDNNNRNIIACFTGSSPTIRKLDPITYEDLGEFNRVHNSPVHSVESRAYIWKCAFKFSAFSFFWVKVNTLCNGHKNIFYCLTEFNVTFFQYTVRIIESCTLHSNDSNSVNKCVDKLVSKCRCSVNHFSYSRNVRRFCNFWYILLIFFLHRTVAYPN